MAEAHVVICHAGVGLSAPGHQRRQVADPRAATDRARRARRSSTRSRSPTALGELGLATCARRRGPHHRQLLRGGNPRGPPRRLPEPAVAALASRRPPRPSAARPVVVSAAADELGCASAAPEWPARTTPVVTEHRPLPGWAGPSGSTILERMLGELDGVCPAGELVHLWHRGIELDEPCGCGKPFSDCGFWTQVGDAAFGGWVNVPVERVKELREPVDRTRQIPTDAAPARPDPQFDADLREYTGYYVGALRRDPRGQRLLGGHRLQQASVARVRARRPARPRPAGRPDGPRPARRRLLLDQGHEAAGGRAARQRQSRSSRPSSPARAARLWLGHNASLSLLRRLDVPTADGPPRGRDRRSARPRSAGSPSWVGLPADIRAPGLGRQASPS